MEKSRQGGFTLIEVVITAAFFATAFLAVFSLFTTINILNRQSRNLTSATELAAKVIEGYRNVSGFDALPQPGTIDRSQEFESDPLFNRLGKPRQVTVLVEDVRQTSNTQVKKIEVKIGWHEGGAEKHAELATYMSGNGVSFATPDEVAAGRQVIVAGELDNCSIPVFLNSPLRGGYFSGTVAPQAGDLFINLTEGAYSNVAHVEQTECHGHEYTVVHLETPIPRNSGADRFRIYR